MGRRFRWTSAVGRHGGGLPRVSVTGLCAEPGVSGKTYYEWRKRHDKEGPSGRYMTADEINDQLDRLGDVRQACAAAGVPRVAPLDPHRQPRSTRRRRSRNVGTRSHASSSHTPMSANGPQCFAFQTAPNGGHGETDR